MRKRFAFISALFFLLISVFFPLIALATSDNGNSQGLPYNDYEKYRYFVRDVSKHDYGTESNITIPISITVRNKETQVILSNDKYIITFDNLPQSKLIAQEDSLKLNAGARFDFDVYIPFGEITSEKEIESMWKEHYVSNYSTMEETTLFGRPALVSTGEAYADYIVYMNDVKLPTGIAVFSISLRSSFDFAMQGGTTQAKDFENMYKGQQYASFEELQDQFSKITIKVEKQVNLRDKKTATNTNPGTNEVVDTEASETSGETSIAVAAVIVVAGAAAAATGAGAAAMEGNGGEDSKENNSGSRYKMAIKKDFGSKIKYDTDTVYVYARMIEIKEDGTEIDRPDLTQKITIFSKDPSLLEVSDNVIDGIYMGAGIIAGKSAGPEVDSEAIISFRFEGEGGTFQNNVKFRVIGECYIELEKEDLFILAASGRSFELPYELVNFMEEADEITVRSMNDNSLFDLSLGKNKDEKTVILATDKTEKKPIERFFDSFNCEIIAKNKKEYARSVFSAVVCYEGILPDFLGKEKEILAYKNTEGEMPITDIAFRLGLWNENEKALELSRPEEIEVSFTDEQGIFEVIGLENEINIEKSTSDYLVHSFKADKSLPNTSPVKGTLMVSYHLGEVSFESETEVKLMPDILSYEQDLEKEYQNCIRIIDTYMPPEFAGRKLKELNANRDKMGLKDLQLFRKKCWEIAFRSIMQDKENYMIESYWYDEAIATAELVVYVGDIALDVALAPFGGPITGFVVTQVKSALIELVSMRIEKGSIGYNEIYDLIMKRLEQAAGQADGLIEVPSFDKPKALIAWLSCYILYRIMYRWYFDKDERGNPKGLTEAIQNGLMDFAGKGASILLGEYAKDIAKKRGIDIDSTADKEQKWVNENVESAAKKGLDAMDSLADSLDKKIDEITASLLDFIDRIKNGGISFS